MLFPCWSLGSQVLIQKTGLYQALDKCFATHVIFHELIELLLKSLWISIARIGLG